MSGTLPTPGIDVHLGNYDYRVQPQRHAYLKRELRGFADSLGDLGELDAENILDVFTDRIYEVLKVFIPDLMPQWEWDGFGSPAQAERDEYEREADHSPTPPEIKAALLAAISVNDFDWVGQLKNFIGPDLIRQQIRVGLTTWSATQAEKTSSQLSQRSQRPNGASAPESSGTTDPISAGTPT